MSKRLWLWFSAVVAVFAAATLILMLNSEHRYKKEILSARLEGYADIVARSENPETLEGLFPENIRITVLSPDGTVHFDNLESADALDNHLARPEIRDCLSKGVGYGLRRSETADREYFYFARRYGDRIVRTALPFEIQEMRFFRPSALLIWSLVLLLAGALAAAFLISRSFGREAADRLQTQKRSMTNNIAHELRTPVTSIRGYLETLQSNPGMDDRHRQLFINRAYSQSLRLSDLIRDISLVTKIEEAPELLVREEIRLGDILAEVQQEFSGQISSGGFKVLVSIPQELTLQGNQTLVYSIFRNLLENSLRYSGEGSTIRIEGRREADGSVRFRFSDNGKGVAAENLDRIFERFYRVPGRNGEKGSGEGSGLGLSIVRNAVAFHGGSIRASLLSPHGLCFDFDLKSVR